ncbi:hypothetical protein VPNG_06232 [Cytospora leucostoma]|uniref:2EXR domain-containing protein n=1 Tax=Cytospora leucostoma TaxID=1230097 RepID=A0A423WYP6_9PEZI|nr:hypothetical protein VPNG_06232 [Cytospora leucostoma]
MAQGRATSNSMQPARCFPHFPNLPPEIQLQIWESTTATLPSMHVFDIRTPSSPAPGGDNSVSSTQDHEPTRRVPLCLEEPDDMLYINALETGGTSQHPMTTTQGARFRWDPSMYKFRDSLRATSIDSARTMQTARNDVDVNTIRLRTGRAITYDNTQDVLHLRFVPPASQVPKDARRASPISAMFESVWSEELAKALHYARRIAIDVSQLWPDLAGGQSDLLQDIAYLACVLQNDLEVLYLVDYCAGRCNSAKAGDLMSRDAGLYRKMYCHGNGGVSGFDKGAWDHEKRREPDVFHGVGRLWREVFDVEKMNWTRATLG